MDRHSRDRTVLLREDTTVHMLAMFASLTDQFFLFWGEKKAQLKSALQDVPGGHNHVIA